MRVSLTGLKANEIPLMLEELGNLGEVQDPQQTDNSLEVTLLTTASEEDICAVLCFVLEPEQISFTTPPTTAAKPLPSAEVVPPTAACCRRAAQSAESEGQRIDQYSRGGRES